MRSVVSVCTRWGDYVLGVRDLRPGQALSVGSPPQRLVRFRGGAAWLCDSASSAASGERALREGETVTIERDGVEYSVTCSAGDGATFGAPRRWLAPLGGAASAGALVAVLTLLFVPRLPRVQHPRALMSARPDAPVVELPDRTPIRADVFAEAAEPQPRPRKPPGDMQCGHAKMGARVADSRGSYGVSGPKDSPDVHLARPMDGVGYPTAPALASDGELGLARPRPGSRGPTATFARETALGRDAVDARGDMWGDAIADAVGEQGLGLAASPGGVVKRIDVAAVAEPAPTLRVVHTGLRVDGARKASEIGRAMAAHFDEFRGCAAAAPSPEARQVQLEFDVAADGRASATGAEADSLEQCLDERVARIGFAAETNAWAHVVYPLYFVPTTAGLHPPPAAPPPLPAACDCGG